MVQLQSVLPPPVRFSTEGVSPGEAVALWEATMAEARCGVSASRVEGPFAASILVQDYRFMTLAENQATKAEVARSSRNIANSSPDAIFLFQQLGEGGAVFHREGQEALLRPGDIVVADSEEPFFTRTPGRAYHHRSWILPRSLIRVAGVRDGDFGRPVRLSRRRPINRLISSFFAEVQRGARGFGLGELESAAQAAAWLLTGALRPERPVEPLRAAVDAARLGQLKTAIERRLADPLLSPRRIAAECGVSVRKLHLLFEPTGVSFREYVIGRRLAVARRILTDPAQDVRAVSHVAFDLGFNSLATFYRAYGSVYGETPGDTRAFRPPSSRRAGPLFAERGTVCAG